MSDASVREFRPSGRPPSGGGWWAEMRWQEVINREGEQVLILQVEPMFDVPDLVYVPVPPAWLKTAPPWAKDRREQILARLKTVKWHRELDWREGDGTVSTNPAPIPGSLQSTPGGRQFERRGCSIPTAM
jgi:hypothetical protein